MADFNAYNEFLATRLAVSDIPAGRLCQHYSSGGDTEIEMCLLISDIPYCVTRIDSPAYTTVPVTLLGVGIETCQIVADGTITINDLVVMSSYGRVRKLPTTPGTYHCVGIALSSATNAKLVNILHDLPHSITV